MSLFSKGFTWFYWQYHRDNKKRVQIPGNEDDFDGYTEQQLYVPCKYNSYKDETLQHLNMASYEVMMTKAKQYINSTAIRAMTPNYFGYIWLKYGVSKTDKVDMNHVIALILYCDYSAYCTEFSGTFRRLSRLESMEDVKKRNSAYWFQSRYIREVIECFGINNDTQVLQDGIKAEPGPFYCGIDVVLAIPQFSLRLCGPTSTSKHLEVSLNFSKRTGMIIELDNPTQDPRAAAVPFVDVLWLSRFPDEDERIFAGLSCV